MIAVTEFLAKVHEEYTVVDGIIRNPGKFECECVWVPYYWELALDGEGEDEFDGEGEDESDGDGEVMATRFVVDSEEAEAFGLECGATVELFEDSQGFVIGSVLD